MFTANALSDPAVTPEVKEAMLEAVIEAALGGHDLGAWERVDDDGNEFQARCKLCGMTTWVGGSLRYSILEDTCPGWVGEE